MGTIKLTPAELANANGTMTSAWSFDTVRSVSTIGSSFSANGGSVRVRDVRHVLNLSPQEEDEDAYGEDNGDEHERAKAEVERAMALLREQGVVVNDDDEGMFDYGDEDEELDEEDEQESYGDGPSDYGSSRAVSGTEPRSRPGLGDLGLNSGAAHSTVKIMVRPFPLHLLFSLFFRS